jgi:hypothetical protein
MMLSSRQFTFNSGNGSAFISDFGKNFRFEQIYPDACDQGVLVVSEKTGKVAKYAVERELIDGEGELQGWQLAPTRETVRQLPSLAGKSLMIYND